ncbi:hypothetical protein [Archangium sp. Cb G35]|uniref:hypothetical protein n=1 Tax=Archangium sp. Cb G35 TaxID=1920190 RepID=UPI000A44C472|nr:hypothetical protein [Archangium sp. Cb G35]
MKHREPYLGFLTAIGLVVMLLGEGVVDLAGLLLAATPLGYGLVCWLRAPPSA